MKNIQNKYRISSARLQSWDYRNSGIYFITICTKNRVHHFGNIIDEKMHLNKIGQLAEKFWTETIDHFPLLELGNFVIMPDHMHGILIINDPIDSSNDIGLFNDDGLFNDGDTKDVLSNDNLRKDVFFNDDSKKDVACYVSTDDLIDFDPHLQMNNRMAKISPKPGSISTIIRSYKSAVTKHARNINVDFHWQPRFHDHIIRNAESFNRIQNYISNNPMNWGEK